MKAIDYNKIGLIAIAALTLSACENGLTGPDGQDVEDIDAYQSIPALLPPRPLLPPTPPPVLIFENGNETLCVPSGRSHQLQWQVFDLLGQVNVTLRSREPAATTSVFENTTIRNNTSRRSAEGEGDFSYVIGLDENNQIVRMDPLREYQYTVSPVHQYARHPVYSRSGWFRVSYGGSGGALLCY